ncbi:ATP-binding cassette sub-family A member 2, partial [Pseudolycoriella hygida]
MGSLTFSISENANDLFEDYYSLCETFGILSMDAVIYLAIYWYFSQVFPGIYGTPKPFYFPLVSFNSCCKRKGANSSADAFAEEGLETNCSVKRDVDVLICVIKNSHEMRALKAQAALCFEEYCEPDEFCCMAAMFDPRYKSLKFAPPETREKAIDMLERLVALELDESMKVAE